MKGFLAVLLVLVTGLTAGAVDDISASMRGPFLVIREDNGIDETVTAVRRELITSVTLMRRGRYYITMATSEVVAHTSTTTVNTPVTVGINRTYQFDLDQETKALKLLEQLLTLLSEPAQ